MCVHVCVVEHLLDIITLRCLLTSIFLKKIRFVYSFVGVEEFLV